MQDMRLHMAYNDSFSRTSISQALHAVGSAIGGLFASVGKALVLNSSANQRLRQVEALQAKSDAELAQMGLKREDITRYVFRDILFL